MVKYNYNHKLLDEYLAPTVYEEMKDILDTVMSEPILQQADINKIFYLHTDVCVVCHGNVILQLINNVLSLATMNRNIYGRICEFELTVNSSLKLHLIKFAALLIAPLGLLFAIQKWRPF